MICVSFFYHSDAQGVDVCIKVLWEGRFEIYFEVYDFLEKISSLVWFPDSIYYKKFEKIDLDLPEDFFL